MYNKSIKYLRGIDQFQKKDILQLKSIEEKIRIEFDIPPKNIENLKNQSIENLLSVKGIGDKVAIAVNTFLNNENSWKIITNLQNVGLQFAINESDLKEIADNPIKGKNFLATGKLQKYKRNDIKDIILSKGGNYLSAVSKNLDFLIAGEKAGSKLEKAEKLGVRVLTEEEFEREFLEI